MAEERPRNSTVTIFLTSLLFFSLLVTAAEGADCCSDCLYCAGTDETCIRHSQLCDGNFDCERHEDENEAFCEKVKGSCPPGHHYTTDRYNSYGSCKSWSTTCSSISSSDTDIMDVCSAILGKRLPRYLQEPITEPAPPQIDVDEVVSYLSASNCSSDKNESSSTCPTLYKLIGDTCVAVLPFDVPWPEAQTLCRSIAGSLVEFPDFDTFHTLTQHFHTKAFTTDFWIGGYFNMKEDAWSWSEEKMVLGTPYWTLVHSESCVTRSSPSMGEFPGCYHYRQAPVTSQAGRCAAINFRYRYYLSDEDCYELRKPLCQLNGNH